jgi:hypothetical protein
MHRLSHPRVLRRSGQKDRIAQPGRARRTIRRPAQGKPQDKDAGRWPRSWPLHSAATRLGEAEVPLQLIMGKTRHKNPLTAMRYVKPGAEAIAKVTEVLAPRCRRTH